MVIDRRHLLGARSVRLCSISRVLEKYLSACPRRLEPTRCHQHEQAVAAWLLHGIVHLSAPEKTQRVSHNLALYPCFWNEPHTTSWKRPDQTPLSDVVYGGLYTSSALLSVAVRIMDHQHESDLNQDSCLPPFFGAQLVSWHSGGVRYATGGVGFHVGILAR